MNRSVQRRLPYRVSLAAVAGLLLAAGCLAPQGDPRIAYRRGTEPSQPAAAPYAGEWILYPGNATKPDRTVEVEKGQKLGFRRKADGSIVAVAGEQEFQLQPVLADEYYWKLNLKKDQ
jgi:hypothetical protein